MDPLALICPCCGTFATDFGPGPGRRPNAACRSCGSLERHRFLALLLTSISDLIPGSGVVVDVAPSTQVSSLIKALAPERYMSMDFDPAADGRLVDVIASLTDIPLPADSTAALVCYHVLEHIPDDAKAMHEIARVLAHGGLAVLQVPYRSDLVTDEDPDAPADERVRRFGQADHVRFYGNDFVPRLEASGMVVQEIRVDDVLPSDLVEVIAGQGFERVWICTTPGSPLPDADLVKHRIRLALAASIASAIESTSGVVTTGAVGFGPDGLVGVEADLADRDSELGLDAMLERYRADRAEAVAVAAGAAPARPAPRRPRWQREMAKVLPSGLRRRLRARSAR